MRGPLSAVYRRHRGEVRRNPTLVNLVKVARALHASVEDLMRRAGL
jgi:hypothetical protein